MLHNKRVLVSGCAGLLGSWLCEALLREGALVFGLDRQYPKDSRIHEIISRTYSGQLQTVMVDIRNYADVLNILKSNQIEFVYHLAAQAIVGEAVKDPIATFKDNIEGTWNMLEASRQHKIISNNFRGMVVASSDKAYGDQEQLPYVESSPLEGRYPYDVSKSCTDLLAQSYFYSYQLPVCITRCGNLYGGGDLNWSRIIPGTILSLLEGKQPIIRSDGSPVRDYIYVKDAADAYVAVSKKLISDSSTAGEAFNISSDAPVSVLELVEQLQILAKRPDLTPIILNNASCEIKNQYLSSSKIQAEIQWHPSYSLQQGLAETLVWYKQYFSKIPMFSAAINSQVPA